MIVIMSTKNADLIAHNMCPHCRQNKSLELQNIIRNINIYKCTFCSLVSSYERCKTININREDARKSVSHFICDLCFRRYQSASRLRNHKIKYHDIFSTDALVLDAKIGVKLKMQKVRLKRHKDYTRTCITEKRKLRLNNNGLISDKDGKKEDLRTVQIKMPSNVKTPKCCSHCHSSDVILLNWLLSGEYLYKCNNCKKVFIYQPSKTNEKEKERLVTPATAFDFIPNSDADINNSGQNTKHDYAVENVMADYGTEFKCENNAESCEIDASFDINHVKTEPTDFNSVNDCGEDVRADKDNIGLFPLQKDIVDNNSSFSTYCIDGNISMPCLNASDNTENTLKIVNYSSVIKTEITDEIDTEQIGVTNASTTVGEIKIMNCSSVIKTEISDDIDTEQIGVTNTMTNVDDVNAKTVDVNSKEKDQITNNINMDPQNNFNDDVAKSNDENLHEDENREEMTSLPNTVIKQYPPITHKLQSIVSPAANPKTCILSRKETCPVKTLHKYSVFFHKEKQQFKKVSKKTQCTVDQVANTKTDITSTRKENCPVKISHKYPVIKPCPASPHKQQLKEVIKEIHCSVSEIANPKTNSTSSKENCPIKNLHKYPFVRLHDICKGKNKGHFSLPYNIKRDECSLINNLDISDNVRPIKRLKCHDSLEAENCKHCGNPDVFLLNWMKTGEYLFKCNICRKAFLHRASNKVRSHVSSTKIPANIQAMFKCVPEQVSSITKHDSKTKHVDSSTKHVDSCIKHVDSTSTKPLHEHCEHSDVYLLNWSQVKCRTCKIVFTDTSRTSSSQQMAEPENKCTKGATCTADDIKEFDCVPEYADLMELGN